MHVWRCGHDLPVANLKHPHLAQTKDQYLVTCIIVYAFGSSTLLIVTELEN